MCMLSFLSKVLSSTSLHEPLSRSFCILQFWFPAIDATDLHLTNLFPRPCYSDVKIWGLEWGQGSQL